MLLLAIYLTIYTGNILDDIHRQYTWQKTVEDATPIKCESATARMPDWWSYTIGQNGQATFKGRAI